MPRQAGQGASAASDPDESASAPAAARGAAGPTRFLVVWDFDWSLVEENSDTWVLQRLGAAAAYERLRAEGLPWTQLMDASLRAAHEELGVAEADIQAAARSTPFHPALRKAVRQLHDNAACAQVVLSDANSVYIDEILKHHDLRDCFVEVVTNPAEFRDGALRVAPCHTLPHGCTLCPANLCKGLELSRLLSAGSWERILYVGDGRGDFCPATRLAATDVVAARSHYPDDKPCSLTTALLAAGAPIVGFDGKAAACAPNMRADPQQEPAPGLAAVTAPPALPSTAGGSKTAASADHRTEPGSVRPSGSDASLSMDAVSAVLSRDRAAGTEQKVLATVYGWRTPEELAQMISCIHDGWSKARECVSYKIRRAFVESKQ